MRKVVYTLVLMCFFIGAMAHGDSGIKFFKGTLEEAFAKAKAENKMLFVDVYATW